MKFRLIFILTTIFLSCSSTKEIKRNESSKSELNGITKEFYESGEIKYKWNYKNNLLNGITKEFRENGKLKVEWKYENNLLNGISK
jgi:antitoxin component YwqK of YwqJK toxin-antitoxin module